VEALLNLRRLSPGQSRRTASAATGMKYGANCKAWRQISFYLQRWWRVGVRVRVMMARRGKAAWLELLALGSRVDVW